MSADLAWTWGRLASLSAYDVHDLLALRSRVFVVEQDCVFLDPDDADRDAWHLLVRIVDGPERGDAALAGYLRCLAPGVRYVEASIGRVVTSPEARGTGLGRTLMKEGLARTLALWPDADVRINAQARLEAFYASMGFVVDGTPYDEDGIEHVEMRLASRHGERVTQS